MRCPLPLLMLALVGIGTPGGRAAPRLRAGAALLVAGTAADIKSGVVLAAKSLDSGAAKVKLEALIEASNDPASSSEAVGHQI